MSNLDDELREAVAQAGEKDTDLAQRAASDGTASDGAVSGGVTSGSAAEFTSDSDEEAPSNQRHLGLLLGVLAVGGLGLALVLGSSTDSLQYDTTVDKVLGAGDDAEGKLLNVEGTLVHGTLLKRDEPCEYRFRLKSTDPSKNGDIEVRFPSCIVPDNFRDVAGMDVTVSAKGRLKDGTLTADHISTKCPTKYEMQQRQKLGEQAPHAESKPIIGFDDEG